MSGLDFWISNLLAIHEPIFYDLTPSMGHLRVNKYAKK